MSYRLRMQYYSYSPNIIFSNASEKTETRFLEVWGHAKSRCEAGFFIRAIPGSGWSWSASSTSSRHKDNFLSNFWCQISIQRGRIHSVLLKYDDFDNISRVTVTVISRQHVPCAICENLIFCFLHFRQKTKYHAKTLFFTCSDVSFGLTPSETASKRLFSLHT